MSATATEFSGRVYRAYRGHRRGENDFIGGRTRKENQEEEMKERRAGGRKRRHTCPDSANDLARFAAILFPISPRPTNASWSYLSASN